MKKIITSTLCMVMVALTTLTFYACSDDDEKKSSDSWIVGTWEGKVDKNGKTVGSVTIEFRSNGKGTHSLFGSFSWTLKEKYSGKDGSEGTLRVKGDDSMTYDYEYDADKDKLELEAENGEEYKLYKVGGNYDDENYSISQFVGTWHANYDGIDDYITFYSNGTGRDRIYEEDKLEEDVSFTFTYENGYLILTDADGDPHKIQVISITSSKMVVKFSDGETMTYTKK